MANVYADLDLASGANDGTSWADAFQTPSALNGGSISNGDSIWVQGNTNAHSGSTMVLDFGSDAQNPVNIYGCKQGTTNEPPIQSDLIPGWRTGEARTLANRAYKDADAPLFAVSSSNQIQIAGHNYWYGIKFSGPTEQRIARDAGDSCRFEECLFVLTGDAEIKLPFGAASGPSAVNCGMETQHSGARIQPQSFMEIIGLEYIGTTAPTSGLFVQRANFNCKGADLTDIGANAIVAVSSAFNNIEFSNSQLHASAVLTTGAKGDAAFRIIFSHSASTTGKSSGTILDLDIITESGNITEETTAVRTGGANDGSSDYSFAFTPDVNGTRDNIKSLEGPKASIWVAGDGTSKTLTVYIANSGAGDYQNDEVALKARAVSSAGTAQSEYDTTEMNLLGTPSNVTDDTDSTWGTGGNNPQKLQLTFAPDFNGWVEYWVEFSKNFGASPETLYVDPLLVVS